MYEYVKCFPPMTQAGIPAQNDQALVQRYRLLDELKGPDGIIRRDLHGYPFDFELALEMFRQLVAGVDYPFTTLGDGWPIPAGVRLECLCYSPWLLKLRELLPNLDWPSIFTLPVEPTQQMADQAADKIVKRNETITGITFEHAHDMDLNYGFNAKLLITKIKALYAGNHNQRVALLMLASGHFDAAADLAPELRSAVASKMGYIGNWVTVFESLREQEREAQAVRVIGIVNLLSVTDIKKWLRGNGKKLKKSLHNCDGLQMLLEYALFSTSCVAVLNSGSKRMKTGAPTRIPIDPIFFKNTAQFVILACENDKTGADARAVLLEAFHKFRAVGRSEPLSNDEPLLLWGVNNLVLPGAAQADLSKALPFPRAPQQWGEEYENQAPITNAILQRCDPVMFARLRRRGNRNGNLIKREFNGRSNQRAGTAYGSLMLPSGDIIGGAPRFKPGHQSNRYKDYPLWEALSNNDLTVLTKHLDAHEAILVEDALAELKAMISPVKPMSSADTRHAIMAVCDLATGVSALSCNRDCAGAILNWLDVYCLNESHYDGLIKPHGIRSTDQMDLVFEVRQKIFDADSYLPHLPLNSSSRAPVAAPPFPVKLSSTAPLPPTPRQANTPQRNKARKKNALKNT